MKKLALLLLSSMLTLSACGKSETADPAAADPAKGDAKEAAAPEAAAPAGDAIDFNAVEFTEDGLKSMFKTPGEMSPAEFEALIKSFAKCEAKPTKTSYNYSSCPAAKVYSSEVLNTKTKRKLDPKAKQEILMKHLQDENVVVRDKALRTVDIMASNAGLGSAATGDGLMAGDEETIKKLIDVAKAEKDPLVYAALFERFLWIDNLYKNRPLVDFVLENAKHSDPIVRKSIPEKMAAFRMKGIAEAPQMILDLCQKDEDDGVRAEACADILDYEIPDNMKLAEGILKDSKQAKAHAGLIKALAARSYNKNVDADAYKLMMDYYKSTPRSEDVPAWNSISEVSKNNGKDFGAWKEKATYYKADEIVKAMSDILADPNANWLARTASIDAIVAHGGKDALKAAEAKVQGLKDDKKQKQVLDAIAKALAK